MKITDIVVKPFNKKDSKVVGFATVTLDDALVITNINVIKGSKGLFIGMPSKKGADGEYYDIVFPKTKGLRATMTEAILDKLNLGSSTDDDEDDDIPF